MRKERVGFAVCGSFCTHEQVLKSLEELTRIYETVVPIVSETAAFTDTRFGSSEALLERLKELTGREPLYDIPAVEPIGPKGLLDVLVIAPATGNTIAKLAAGITDTAVTMAAKAHLRNGRPVVLAMASNDGLAAGAKSIGELLVRKTLLLCSVWTGQCDAQALLFDCGLHKDPGDDRCCAPWRTTAAAAAAIRKARGNPRFFYINGRSENTKEI